MWKRVNGYKAPNYKYQIPKECSVAVVSGSGSGQWQWSVAALATLRNNKNPLCFVTPPSFFVTPTKEESHPSKHIRVSRFE